MLTGEKQSILSNAQSRLQSVLEMLFMVLQMMADDG